MTDLVIRTVWFIHPESPIGLRWVITLMFNGSENSKRRVLKSYNHLSLHLLLFLERYTDTKLDCTKKNNQLFCVPVLESTDVEDFCKL